MKIASVSLLAAAALSLSASPAGAATPTDWSTPTVLGHLQSNTISGASAVATSPSGASIAVWSALQGRSYRYLAATRAPGKAWSAPHVLAKNVHNGRFFADISSTGRATAIWTLGIGTGTVHYAVHSGSKWTANRVVPGSSGFDATSFASAPNGYGVLAGSKYVKVNPARPKLSVAYIRKLTPAGKWGPARRVSSNALPTYQGKTHAGTGAADVKAAIDGKGSVIAAWGWTYFQDRSGSDTRLQRTSVGAGGKVGKVVNLVPAPQYRLGVESVQMAPSGAAAIIWKDDEGKTAYVLTKTATGPWASTSRDISSLGIADDETFLVSDAGLAEYWVKTAAASDSTSLSLYTASYGPTGWTDPALVDTDTVAGSDQTSSNGLLAASGAAGTFLLWGTQDITKFLAHQPSDTALLTVYAPGATTTKQFSIGNTGEALTASGSHATALVGRDVAGAAGADLVAVTR
ncbi:MAG TPA: hypothetical protein VHB69_07630 [Mycobacteriales bacterium]|nr:hypothetical protein [Mycobacteriales bacterium]